MGMSSSSFSNFLHQTNTPTYTCLLQRIRIKHAINLLTTTSESVNVIGDRVGFPDPILFNRAFNRELGMPPGKYRKTVKN